MVNLLMGLAMGLSILAAATTWAALQWRTDRQIAQRALAQQDVRALMDTLVHDIRRAQFRGNPQDFQVSAHQILFSTDRNDNAKRDNNECSGFRLNGAALQTQTACQPVVWTTLNDTRTLQIVSLNFRWECENTDNGGSSVDGDLLWIELSSQSANEPVPSIWQRHVRLRNVHAHLRPEGASCSSGA
jgi:type II secretory pathway component PulJ